IFGNAEADSFFFDRTYLGGRTRVYGSNAPTCSAVASEAACSGVYAPLGDGDDFFVVNQLQTMNVAAGHTLTLDGQAGNNTYTINTTGSQPCFAGDPTGAPCHDYVINVLNTGAPDDGISYLTINGYDSPLTGYDPATGRSYATEDIFLLRRTSFIASPTAPSTHSEVANQSAFVALLHGTLGAPVTAFSGNVSLAVDTHPIPAPAGSFSSLPFFVGRRVPITGAGIYSGDFTVQSISTDGSTMRLAENLPSGSSITTEEVPTGPVSLSGIKIGVLVNDVTTSDPSGSSSVRTQGVERINYDRGLNRLIVNGLGGNDYFASDDNSVITTLDGGAGNDTFQIGQIYGLFRDSAEAAASPLNSDLNTRNTHGGGPPPPDVVAPGAPPARLRARGP